MMRRKKKNQKVKSDQKLSAMMMMQASTDTNVILNRTLGTVVEVSTSPENYTIVNVNTSPKRVVSGQNFSVLVACIYTKINDIGTPQCVDNYGRTYDLLDTLEIGERTIMHVFFLHNVSEIARNTLITVNHPISTHKAMIAFEYRNIAHFNEIEDTQSNVSIDESTTITGVPVISSKENQLLIGFIGINGPKGDSLIFDTSWSTKVDIGNNVEDDSDVRLIAVQQRAISSSSGLTGTIGTARDWGTVLKSFRQRGQGIGAGDS